MTFDEKEMKKKILITIAITAAVTSLCWHISNGLRDAYNRVWLISAVKAPGRMALDEIASDLTHSNITAATAKLQILRTEWRRFEAEDGIDAGIGNIMVDFSRLPPQELKNESIEQSVPGYPPQGVGSPEP